MYLCNNSSKVMSLNVHLSDMIHENISQKTKVAKILLKLT